MSLLTEAKAEFNKIVQDNNLQLKNIEINAVGLSPEEAIGDPDRQNFPLLQGEEVMIEASFKDYRGQAFTDQPGEFTGTLKEILELELDNNYNRALFVAAVNAVLRSLDLVEKTVHCRDNEMEDCVREMVAHVRSNHPNVEKMGIIGFQPALLEIAASELGTDNVVITDLNQDRIGTKKYGVEILAGNKQTEHLIAESDFVLSTGSTMVNDTARELLELFANYERNFAFYGNTITGLAYLLDLPQLCFYGRKG